MKKKFLNCVLPVLMAFTFITCKEEPSNSPPASNATKNDKLSSKSFVVSLNATDSEEPLIDHIKNPTDNAEIFNVQSNVSSKYGTGSISFYSKNGKNNSFFPENIEVNSNIIKYKFDGKEKSLPLDSRFVDVIKKVKDDREKKENKPKNLKINWATLSPEEVSGKLKEKGYQVVSLGNDRYEITRQFQPTDDINNKLQIKMIFNSKTGMPESSELSKDGRKLSENILETKNGKSINHTKIYGANNSRKEKNLILTTEH